MAWPSKVMSLLASPTDRRRRPRASARDQIDPGDRLGDRMLHLQAGVHLDEVELAVLVEELDGARAAIAQLGIALAQISPISCAACR
jgi:hypothetical protein